MLMAILWLLVCLSASAVSIGRRTFTSVSVGLLFAGESIMQTVTFALGYGHGDYALTEASGTIYDAWFAILLAVLWGCCRGRCVWLLGLAAVYVIQLGAHAAYAAGDPTPMRQYLLQWCLNVPLAVQVAMILAGPRLDDLARHLFPAPRRGRRDSDRALARGRA